MVIRGYRVWMVNGTGRASEAVSTLFDTEPEAHEWASKLLDRDYEVELEEVEG